MSKGANLDDILDPDDDTDIQMTEYGYGLTLRQLRFVQAWMANGGNATRAYKDAGYQSKDDKVATTCASRLLTYAGIRRYIADTLGRQNITPQRILGMLQREADTSPSHGARVKATEVLAKAKGLFSDAVHVKVGTDGDALALVDRIAKGDPAVRKALMAHFGIDDDTAADGASNT